MDYEKAYKEALERAKKRFNANPTDGYVGYGNEILKEIFPELIESEDEKIRKQLINEVKEQINNIPAPDCCSSDDLKRLTILESWLTYLEKQKDKDKCPEFCVRSHCIGCSIYEKQKESSPAPTETLVLGGINNSVAQDEALQEWTEQSEDERIRKEIISFIKEFEKDHYRCIDFRPWIAYLERQKEQKPALDDYLKATPAERRKMSMTGILEKEQKPAEWSEEDENRFNNLCWIIDDSKWNEASKQGFKNFLKSLRPQPHWKPSEEQMEALKDAIQGYYACREKELLMDLYEHFLQL